MKRLEGPKEELLTISSYSHFAQNGCTTIKIVALEKTKLRTSCGKHQHGPISNFVPTYELHKENDLVYPQL